MVMQLYTPPILLLHFLGENLLRTLSFWQFLRLWLIHIYPYLQNNYKRGLQRSDKFRRNYDRKKQRV